MHIANKFQRPAIFQLNIKGLTASKTNILYYLTLQSEALIILLQETHCTNAEKLALPSFKQAWSCQVCPRETKVYTFGPISTDIGD